MLSAGDASVSLHLGDENPSPIHARDRSGIYSRVLPYKHSLDAGGQSATIYTRDRLASPSGFVQTPFLSHCFNRVVFEIASYNYFGDTLSEVVLFVRHAIRSFAGESAVTHLLF